MMTTMIADDSDRRQRKWAEGPGRVPGAGAPL